MKSCLKTRPRPSHIILLWIKLLLIGLLPFLATNMKQTCTFGWCSEPPLLSIHVLSLRSNTTKRGRSVNLKWSCFVPDYYNLFIWRIDPEHKEVYEVNKNLLPETSECWGCWLNTDVIRKRTAPVNKSKEDAWRSKIRLLVEKTTSHI